MIDLLKKYKNTGIGILLSVVFCTLHCLFLKGYLTNYSEENLHLVFASSTFVILLILNTIYYKKSDYVGYSFMALTIIKMIFLIVYFKKIIQTAPEILKPEKTTILVLFLIYLAIETVLIAQLLNKKQKK